MLVDSYYCFRCTISFKQCTTSVTFISCHCQSRSFNACSAFSLVRNTRLPKDENAIYMCSFWLPTQEGIKCVQCTFHDDQLQRNPSTFSGVTVLCTKLTLYTTSPTLHGSSIAFDLSRKHLQIGFTILSIFSLIKRSFFITSAHTSQCKQFLQSTIFTYSPLKYLSISFAASSQP